MKWLNYVGLCIIFLYNTNGQNLLAQNNETTQGSNVGITHNQALKNTNSNLMFEPLSAITAYENNFENGGMEIFSLDFDISTIPGIDSKTLHTPHPYLGAFQKDSVRDITAQIMHPIIIRPNGNLQFDEIVLVEPTSIPVDSDSKNSGDFVVVEGSSDKGRSWQALTPKYNSSTDEVWNHIFTRSIINNHSFGKGSESIFKHRSINLIDNKNFFEGDTIFVRFRLSSNLDLSGWGWAIDNIEIKQDAIEAGNLLPEDFKIYPNPIDERLIVDCANIYGPEHVDLLLTDQFGRIYYQEKNVLASSIKHKIIDVSNLRSGMYLLTISDQKYFHKTRKVIKN
jgi:hypothetical protein